MDQPMTLSNPLLKSPRTLSLFSLTKKSKKEISKGFKGGISLSSLTKKRLLTEIFLNRQAGLDMWLTSGNKAKKASILLIFRSLTGLLLMWRMLSKNNKHQIMTSREARISTLLLIVLKLFITTPNKNDYYPNLPWGSRRQKSIMVVFNYNSQKTKRQGIHQKSPTLTTPQHLMKPTKRCNIWLVRLSQGKGFSTYLWTKACRTKGLIFLLRKIWIQLLN